MSRVFIVGIVLLICCAPAQAATARTVATSGQLTLQARKQGGKLCLTLRRQRHYQGEVCGAIPRSPHRALVVGPDVDTDIYAAAVPPSVRTAETESRSGQRKRHRTYAAHGFSARFVLIPAKPAAVFVRFYAQDGTLLGMDAGPGGYIDIAPNATPVFGDRYQGVEAHTEPRIAPAPEQADRLRTLACVNVVDVTGGTGVCDDESENGVAVMTTCGSPGVIGGIVAAGVASVRLTLGSGAELVVAAGELPAAFGGRRAIGAALPSGEAVRAAAALDAAGQVVAGTAVGAAPGGLPCAGEDRDGDRFSGPLVPPAPPAGAVAVTSAGGQSLLVADQGDTLCVALRALPAASCPPPPVDSDDPRLLRQGASVAGVLSRDAARITLTLDRGKAVTARTTDGAAYTGRWAGAVRFFAARVPSGRRVTGATVRDAAGAIIGVSAGGIPRTEVHRRVLAQGDGQALHLVRRAGEQPCVTAFATDLPPAPSFCTDPNPGTPIDGPFHPYSAAVTVMCAPRRAMAYGRFPDALPAPRVILEGDRVIRSRRIALAGEDAWVAFLPDAAVLALQAGEHRVALDLPPASQQCGYSARRSF